MEDKKKKILKLSICLFLFVLILGVIFTKIATKVQNKEFLTVYGNVEIRQVDLSFKVQGRIEKMLKEEGDYVQKGDLLAVLDDIKYEAKFNQTAAEIEAQNAKLQNAEQIYQKHLPLCVDGTTSKEMCETYLNNKNEAQSELEANVQENKSAKDDLENTKIYAPNDGTITTRVVETGAVVNVAEPVYTLSLAKPVWVRAYINEKSLGNITYGQEAKVMTDSIDPKTGKKREYKGWIGYISPVAEFTPKTVQTTDLRTDLVYRIRVYVFEVDEFLRQGMPTSVKINILNPTINKDLKIDDN